MAASQEQQGLLPRGFDRCAEALLSPLDWLRRAVLAWGARPFASLFARRSRRAMLLALFGVGLCFCLTATAPLLLLALGPILFGIPHIAADLRYLVIRRGLHRRLAVRLWVLAPLGLMFFVPPLPLAGCVTIGAAIAARGSSARRLLVGCLGLALLSVGALSGRPAEILFAHIHNLIAIGLWWWMRPAKDRLDPLFPLSIIFALTLLLCFVPLSLGPFADSLPTLSIIRALVISDEDPQTTLRWLYAFAFGQSLHYFVWLRLMPEELRERPAPRSFVSSYRALRSSFGFPLFIFALSLALLLLLFASINLGAAHEAYFRMALFHGPLEVAFASLAFAESRKP